MSKRHHQESQRTSNSWDCISSAAQSPNDHDVLFGRGNAVKSHPGNVYFRSLVAEVKFIWKASPKFDPRRAELVRTIVEAVHTRTPTPGRFLKRDTETGLWTEVSHSKAFEKTQKALRDCDIGISVEDEKAKRTEEKEEVYFPDCLVDSFFIDDEEKGWIDTLFDEKEPWDEPMEVTPDDLRS